MNQWIDVFYLHTCVMHELNHHNFYEQGYVFDKVIMRSLVLKLYFEKKKKGLMTFDLLK